MHEPVMLLPAFDPVITPKDEEWEDLQMTFSHTFKNAPYEYHNGGLWPMVTGFYAASLALRGKAELAERYRDGIDAAIQQAMDGREWSFPEYLHGKEHTPGGHQPDGLERRGQRHRRPLHCRKTIVQLTQAPSAAACKLQRRPCERPPMTAPPQRACQQRVRQQGGLFMRKRFPDPHSRVPCCPSNNESSTHP